MTPQEFITKWSADYEPLTPITPARLERFNLQPETVEFLTVAGLPFYAEPDLSFANNDDDVMFGISKLTEQYPDQLEGSEKLYEHYVVIGYCRNGDAIAIDTSAHDKIVKLDHEELFAAQYFNSSINSLAAFIILFLDFENEVLADKDPSDGYQVFNFTNDQFDDLIEKMLPVDRTAITEEGFWKGELDILISIRAEHFGVTY